MKPYLLFTIAYALLLSTTTANAITYYNPATKTALVFFWQGSKVNAAECTNVTEEQLRQDFKKTMANRCDPLSPDGVAQEDVNRNFAALRVDVLSQKIKLGSITTDKIIDSQIVLFQSTYISNRAEAIRNIDAYFINNQYRMDARIVVLRIVDNPEYISSEVTQFRYLSRR